MYEQPSGPASIGGVLDSGFKLFRACFAKVVGISILASFVGQIPSLLMTSNMDPTDPTTLVPALGGSLIITILISMLIALVFYGAIIGMIDSVHRGRDMTVGNAFGLGFGCMLPVLGCMLLYGLAIMIGSILLLVPGIILAVSLMFAPYILIIERAGVIESITRSHKLIWGYWWRTTAVIGVAGFIMMVVYALIGMVAGFTIAMDPEANLEPGLSLTEVAVTSMLSGFITPLFYSLSLAAYYDLRLRRAGDDLAERIDAEPSLA